MDKLHRQQRFKKNFNKVVSFVFQPILMPTFGMMLLLFTDIYAFYPSSWKWISVVGTFLFTGLLPATPILIMLRKGEVHDLYISKKEQRTLPYLFSMLSYTFWTLFIYRVLQFPNFITFMAAGSTLSILIITLINTKWKISAHLSGIGGIAGGVFAVSYQLGLMPMILFVFILTASALTAVSRVELKAHTPAQTIAGFSLGFLATFIPGIL